MENKKQATICFIIATLFLSMSLIQPVAAALQACDLSDEGSNLENCDAIAEQQDRIHHIGVALRAYYKANGTYLFKILENEYFDKSAMLAQKVKECRIDEGVIYPVPTGITTTQWDKWGKWTCHKFLGTNHCYRTLSGGVYAFNLYNGRQIKMLTGVNYQAWNNVLPYQTDAYNRTENWYIGKDISTNCVVAINQGKDYRVIAKELCAEQSAKTISTVLAYAVTAAAVTSISTTTYMTIAG